MEYLVLFVDQQYTNDLSEVNISIINTIPPPTK